MDQGPVKPSFNSPSSNGPSYVNRRGKRVTLLISKHAFSRFRERWANLFPNQLLSIGDTERVMVEWFQQASRLEQPSGKLRVRLKRHGKDTLYFKTQCFTFVVQDATIVTVEISDKNRRDLNRHKPASPKSHASPTGVDAVDVDRPGAEGLTEKRKDATRRLDTAHPTRTPVSERLGATRKDEVDSPIATQRPTAEPPGPTRFRIRVSAYSPEEEYRFINLGSYDAMACEGDALRLKDMPGFVDEMLQRLELKCPGWKLVLVMAKLGPRGEQVTVLRYTRAMPS
jgi:hypothetical protein